MYKKPNDLFITEEVKNYIKHGNNFIKKEEKVYKNNINFSLYIGLIQFIEKISKFDIIGIQKLYIEFFKNIINSEENIDIKKRKINDYIKFLEVNMVNKKIFIKKIENIQNELENILQNNDNSNKTIENFIVFLNKNENDKNYLELNNKIQEQLINNPEDAHLFLDFFDIIKCNDDDCSTNSIINNYREGNSIFTLKRDGDIIKLLKIFKNDSITIVANEKDMENILESKNKYENSIIQLTKKYINKIITAIKSVFIQGGTKNIQNGGLILEKLFNIKSFYDLFENMITSSLESLYNSYESFSNKLTGAFKIDWFNEGGLNTVADVLTSHDYNDVKDNFSFRYDNMGEYISNNFNSFFSTFINDANEQKNVISETGINIKKNTLSYLEERSKLQKNSLSSLGITSVSGKAFNRFFGEGMANVNSMFGGSKNKCLKILNLRFVMYSVLMNTHNIKIEFDITNYKDCDDKIEEMDDQNLKYNENFNCLNKTNLYRKNKNNNGSKLKVWDMNNQNLNYHQTLVFPDYVQILKGSLLPNYLNYQLGGSVNEKTTKTETICIDIDHYFDIVDILEKILKKKNKYLKNNDIVNIEKKIINVKKITEEFKIYDNKIDNISLTGYKNKKDVLTEKLNKLISELNNEFVKIVKLNNE